MSSHHGTLEKQRAYAAAHREYYRAYTRAYRAAHRDYFKRANKADALRKRHLINNLKDKPCTDCGINYSVIVMQFDHRPGEIKLHNVSQMESKSVVQILAEVAKCDVVCANCHALRTYERHPHRRAA